MKLLRTGMESDVVGRSKNLGRRPPLFIQVFFEVHEKILSVIHYRSRSKLNLRELVVQGRRKPIPLSDLWSVRSQGGRLWNRSFRLNLIRPFFREISQCHFSSMRGWIPIDPSILYSSDYETSPSTATSHSLKKVFPPTGGGRAPRSP